MTTPRLVLSLSARTVEGAKAGIESATREGADLVEIRLDRWPVEERVRLGELFPTPVPLVGTLRSLAEGGEGPTNAEDRGRWLELLYSLPFEWVDREVARDPSPAPDRLRRSIGSRHLAAPVDWSVYPELAELGFEDGELRKVVAPATIEEFLHRWVPLRASPGAASREGIWMTTGPSGPLSRLWAKRFGSAWTFCGPASGGDVGLAPVEESQPPIDRLRSVMPGEDRIGPLFGLLGHPVRHSRSPSMMNGWLAADGREGLYVAMDVETEREFRDLLPALGEGGFRGLNVTHPWKEVAKELADRAEPAADLAGVANCLTLHEGIWTASLTDAEAVEHRLRELREIGRWNGLEFALLGSGGAARAALVAAQRLQATVRLWARRDGAVEALRGRFPGIVRGPGRDPAELVLNATTVGRSGSPSLDPGAEHLFGRGTYCVDVVYGAEDSDLRRRTLLGGGTYEDGLRLLEYQGAESYRRWFGSLPPRSDR